MEIAALAAAVSQISGCLQITAPSAALPKAISREPPETSMLDQPPATWVKLIRFTEVLLTQSSSCSRVGH
jgi:hypothetical protein